MSIFNPRQTAKIARAALARKDYDTANKLAAEAARGFQTEAQDLIDAGTALVLEVQAAMHTRGDCADGLPVADDEREFISRAIHHRAASRR